MKRETFNKANEIIENIKRHEVAIDILDCFKNKTEYQAMYYADGEELEVFFEPDEIELIIENKKQRIAELEKELEEL